MAGVDARRDHDVHDEVCAVPCRRQRALVLREPARAFLNALLTLTRQGDVEAIRRGMQTFRDEPEVQYRGQAALTLLNDTNGGHIPPPRFGNV